MFLYSLWDLYCREPSNKRKARIKAIKIAAVYLVVRNEGIMSVALGNKEF